MSRVLGKDDFRLSSLMELEPLICDLADTEESGLQRHGGSEGSQYKEFGRNSARVLERLKEGVVAGI